MDFSKAEKQWIDFYDNMAEGNIPYNSKFYEVPTYSASCSDEQQGNADPSIKIVSPTAQQVEAAKAQVKRRIARTPKAIRRVKVTNIKKRINSNKYSVNTNRPQRPQSRFRVFQKSL